MTTAPASTETAFRNKNIGSGVRDGEIKYWPSG
jgi:hypothetical protein